MSDSRISISYFRESSVSQARKKNRILMRHKFSFEAKVVIGSTIFAFASSAVLYFIPPSQSDKSLRGPFIPYYGHAYLKVVKYPIARMNEARLYEDGKPLGSSESNLPDIVEKGNGLYKVYINVGATAPILMFSSSDNTDPNTNGRKYRLE